MQQMLFYPELVGNFYRFVQLDTARYVSFLIHKA